MSGRGEGSGVLAAADAAATVAALLLGAGVAQTLATAALGEARAAALLPLISAAWLGLYAWAVARLCLAFGGDWLAWLARHRPLLVVVLATALASAAWSIDPALTAQRTLHLVGTTLIGVAIGLVVAPLRLLRLTGTVLAILVAGGLALAVIAPEHGRQLYGDARVWSGLQGDKNNFGLAAALAVLVFATRPFFRGAASHLAYAPVIALALVAVVRSDSATALGALAAGGAVCALFVAPLLARLPRASGVLVALAALAVGIAGLIGLGVGDAFGLLGRSQDLTGRAELWRIVARLIESQPLTGVGYGALWFPRPGEEATQMAALGTNWAAYHAHNGVLQLASELGLPATLAALGFVVQATAEAVRLFWRSASPFALLMIGINVALIVNNVFEARWFVDRSLPWLLLVALTTALRASADALADARHGAAAATPRPPSA